MGRYYERETLYTRVTVLARSCDCLCVEQTYSALLLTRRLIAQTLAEKIERDQ